VGIQGDQISALGELGNVGSIVTYEVPGNVVSPGFVDMHSHSDLMLLADPLADEKTFQGVTSELLGQDGLGVAPVKPDDLESWRKLIAPINGNPPIPWEWKSFEDYLKALELKGSSTNVSILVPHGNLRMWAMGMADRQATEHEMHEMRSLLAECLREGGSGFSTGLAYAPACYSSKEELIALGK
jgi:N-acyl-D-amino-acid deacylase